MATLAPFGTAPFGTSAFGGSQPAKITYPGMTTYPSLTSWPGYSEAALASLVVETGDPYVAALRGPHTMWHTVTAIRDGLSVWDSELQIVGGSVTDDISAGVRRTANLTVVPEAGLFDALAPIGSELVIKSVLRFPSGNTLTIPHGVFVVDVQRLGYAADGNLTLTAPDRWVRVQRARFINPQSSVPGMRVSEQIAVLIRGGLGSDTTVINKATSQATVGALVWDTDRDKAITGLAQSIGAYVSFDRDGVCTIEDLPTLGTTPSWSVNSGEKGILLAADRERNRQRTYNVVKVSSDKSDGTEPFQPVIAWDSDAFSPTYAGPDPINRPDLAGSFGVVPYFYTSPVLDSAEAAAKAAYTILYRVTGTAASLTLSSVKNPALDALDVIDVLLPREGGGARGGTIERHIVDRVTHPLTPEGAQQIETRSTRTDEYT